MPTYPEQRLAKSEDLVRLVKFAKLQRRALRLFPGETRWETTAKDALDHLKSSALDYIAHEVHKSAPDSQIPKLSPALRAPCDAISGILERYISAGADRAERRCEVLKVVAPYMERAVDSALAAKIADQINSARNAAPDTRRQSYRFTSESVIDLVAQVGKLGNELSNGVRETATCFDDRRIDSLTTVRSAAAVQAQIKEIEAKLEQPPVPEDASRAAASSPSSEQLADWLQRQDGDRQLTYEELRARYGQAHRSLREDLSTPPRRDSPPVLFRPDINRNRPSPIGRNERIEPAEEPDNGSPWDEQLADWLQRQDGDRQLTYEELRARYGGVPQSSSEDDSLSNGSPSPGRAASSPPLSNSDRNTHSLADRDERGELPAESDRDSFRRKHELEGSDDDRDGAPAAKRRQLNNRSRSSSAAQRS